MRFHMIDRIEEIVHGKYITAVKCISLADDVFNEHFPGHPIFPGSLIFEGLAQLSGSFFEMTMKERGLPVKRSIVSVVNKLKFRKPAGPGDRLLYRADIVAMQDDYGVARVSAELDGEMCAAGELMFAFVEMPNEKITRSREELYEIVTKNTKIIRDVDEDNI
jgi:3-hydroxyacyl-[acyl-carrier-protein] dehydratase